MCLVCGNGCGPTRPAQIPFDSKGWQDEDPILTDIRAHMIVDLLSRHQFVGMKADEIETLLGKPTIVEHPGEVFQRYWYYLGNERLFGGYGMKSVHLCLEFSNRVCTVVRTQLD
jgi:hypothetical protein